MDFEIFSELYNESFDYDDVEVYIVERGFQDWMEDYCGGSEGIDITESEAVVINDMLIKIFGLSKMSVEEMRKSAKLSRAAFCKIYNIPSTTVQTWEYGISQPPIYVKELIAYTLFLKEFGDAKVLNNRRCTPYQCPLKTV